MKKLLFYSLIFISSISLSACLNVRRDIKFDAKGKGNEKMTVELGKEFMQMVNELSQLDESAKTDPYDDKKFISDITSALSGTPGIKINDITSVMGADSSNTLKIDYNFEKVTLIADAMKENKGSSDTIISYYTKGDFVYFSYLINMNSDQPEDSASSSMIESYDELFANDKLIMNIDFPLDIVYSNGTSVNGKKVTWEIPMKEVMKKEPVKITAVMKKK